MSNLEKQLVEDRMLRNAAKAVLMADIEHAKNTLSPEGVAERVAGRIGDGAKDVFEVAKTHADDNRGVLAALIGALLLWIVREPILEILGLSDAPEDLDASPADEPIEDGETISPDSVDRAITPETPSSPGDDDEQ